MCSCLFDRCHESIDRGLVKSLLRMLVDLQMYQEVFEIEFLTETESVYRAESLRMMRDPEFTVSVCVCTFSVCVCVCTFYVCPRYNTLPRVKSN